MGTEETIKQSRYDGLILSITGAGDPPIDKELAGQIVSFVSGYNTAVTTNALKDALSEHPEALKKALDAVIDALYSVNDLKNDG